MRLCDSCGNAKKEPARYKFVVKSGRGACSRIQLKGSLDLCEECAGSFLDGVGDVICKHRKDSIGKGRVAQFQRRRDTGSGANALVSV